MAGISGLNDLFSQLRCTRQTDSIPTFGRLQPLLPLLRIMFGRTTTRSAEPESMGIHLPSREGGECSR
jgi:hypothetical protein